MNEHVSPIRPQDAASVGALLALSHAEYPAFVHLFPGPVARHDILLAFLTATAADAARQGGALLARDQHGVLGAALWMPPHTFPLTPLRKARMTPAMLRIALRAPREFRDFARVGSYLEGTMPVESAWYLQAMGVHPRAQRRGIGRQLLAPVLAMADHAAISCHLHTSDPANVDYYRQHGFQVSDPAIAVTPAGPRYIAMSRTPSHPQ
ncbi:MAG: GNAT family N-acetyltransferase [Ornithinimicrobium sp.]